MGLSLRVIVGPEQKAGLLFEVPCAFLALRSRTRPSLGFPRSCFALGLDLRTWDFSGASPFRSHCECVCEKGPSMTQPPVFRSCGLRCVCVWLCFRGAAPPLPSFPGGLLCCRPCSLFPYATWRVLGVRCGEGRCHVRPRHRPRLKPAGYFRFLIASPV